MFKWLFGKRMKERVRESIERGFILYGHQGDFCSDNTIIIDSKDNADLIEGAACAENREYDEAIKCYNRAIAADPDNAVALYYRSAAYVALGEYEKAIADHGRIIGIYPDSSAPYYYRGNVYAVMGKYLRAIADYNRAIKIAPDNDAYTYNNRGFAYFKLGMYRRAIADYDCAIEIDKNYADIYYNRALARKALGNTARAERDMQKYRELGGEEDLDEKRDKA